MNHDKQRIAIAEACGWTELVDIPYRRGVFGTPPNGGVSQGSCVPNYLNDLNAMHDAEKTLTNNQFWDYHKQLAEIVHRDYLQKCVPVNLMSDSDISATATQRAEAFLRTIGKWEEE